MSQKFIPNEIIESNKTILLKLGKYFWTTDGFAFSL